MSCWQPKLRRRLLMPPRRKHPLRRGAQEAGVVGGREKANGEEVCNLTLPPPLHSYDHDAEALARPSPSFNEGWSSEPSFDEAEEQNFSKIGLAVWITVRGGLYFVLDCVNHGCKDQLSYECMNDQLSNLVQTFLFEFSVWSKGANLRELCFTLQKAFTCHKFMFFQFAI
jgi:hypothetical protein